MGGQREGGRKSGSLGQILALTLTSALGIAQSINLREVNGGSHSTGLNVKEL